MQQFFNLFLMFDHQHLTLSLFNGLLIFAMTDVRFFCYFFLFFSQYIIWILCNYNVWHLFGLNVLFWQRTRVRFVGLNVGSCWMSFLCLELNVVSRFRIESCFWVWRRWKWVYVEGGFHEIYGFHECFAWIRCIRDFASIRISRVVNISQV